MRQKSGSVSISFKLSYSIYFNIIIQNREGDVPLHTAINFQKNEVAELLLSYSAVDPTVTNADGNNSLHLAIAKGELRLELQNL